MKLSKHLTLKEATKSATAIKNGIDNTPTIAQLEVLKALAVNIFEPCRQYIGGPLAVTSGYRGEELNKLIGGSLTSDHCISDDKTAALDLDCDVYNGKTNAQLFNYIRTTRDFKQLIWEFGDENNPDWVHVSFSTDPALNKREVLLAKREGRRTVYEYYKAK